MPTTVEIDFSSAAIATALFSYPNTGHENQTLEETIEHYLNDSLSREGLANFQVAAGPDGGGYKVAVTLGDAAVAEQIRASYQAFFDMGRTGLQDAQAFQGTGKWSASWEFLLPVGVPITFAYAVEVMDFPPLTLISNQDYLKSKTTSRWWELLVENGVTDGEKARYSCILDIVPVAAPASDGANLDQSGIYNGPFDSYSLGLLELLARSQTAGAQRPLMALGMPIRTWVHRLWNLAINVGDVGTIKLQNGASCAIMGSNHPSFFYYAVHSQKGPGSAAKNQAAGLAVMKQDIVASAWQAAMGAAPNSDPSATLAACVTKWANRDDELLDLVKQQSGIIAPATLAFTFQDVSPHLPSPPNLRLLERQFYTEGRKSLPEAYW
jgi:hypothetical protein